MLELRRSLFAAALALVCVGCADSGAGADAGDPRVWRRAPSLLLPVTNNAVAAAETNGSCTLYNAMGVDETLTPAGFGIRAQQWHEGTERWLAMPSVPSDAGRIAASAAVVRNRFYVLGGYKVEEDGAEISFGAVHAFDIATAAWATVEPLPVYVGDQVAVAWRDRWIVSVGGRSDGEPVNAVQVFDAESGTWAAGTAFPGTPVFGHAGALVGDQLLIVDGATRTPDGIEMVNQAWLATLDPEDPSAITWEDLGEHLGPARYRAAGGFAWGQIAWFHGGSEEAYNYDGRAYATDLPVVPLPTTLVFDFAARSFAMHDKLKPVATMDHRSLVNCGGRLYTLGGLVQGPEVTSDVWVYTY